MRASIVFLMSPADSENIFLDDDAYTDFILWLQDNEYDYEEKWGNGKDGP